MKEDAVEGGVRSAAWKLALTIAAPFAAASPSGNPTRGVNLPEAI